jgi:signal transduction histidine kinase
MFPVWRISVGIPVFPIIGLGTWIYGRRITLPLLLLTEIYFYTLTSYIYVEYLVIYQYPLPSFIILTTVVFLVDTLRNQFNSIKTTNQMLDQLVVDRTVELYNLANRLINESEQMRILCGQLLHDGIGQHMTGIQLYSTSLAEQLNDEQNYDSTLAYSLWEQGNDAHNKIRKIARTMFPVKIGEVGLISALQELASCFSELEHVDFTVKEFSDLPKLPENIALQLYRICQESANHACYHLKATRIYVEIFSTNKSYSLKFGHNGSSSKNSIKNSAYQLIEHRLQKISGSSETGFSIHGLNNTIYSIPNPDITVTA